MAPPLVDDVVAEILRRLPPYDPACLVRASLVCMSWRRILSDPAFLGYRASFHGAAPPVLGFFHGRSFFPTATAPPLSPPDLWILDCRHGRVLGRTCDAPASLVVWDPVTGVERQRLPLPEYRSNVHFTAAVLCASAAAAAPDACDHLDCRGAPFLVLFVATDGKAARGRACTRRTP